MKPLKAKPHGYIDFLAIASLFLAPAVFGFSDTPRMISYVIGAAYLSLVLLTAYPMGVIKAIPFTVHGGIELATAGLLAAMPWIAGFADEAAARNFFIVSGGGLLAVWLVTDYKSAPYGNYHHPKVSHA